VLYIVIVYLYYNIFELEIVGSKSGHVEVERVRPGDRE
jgi:hypothetical protein